MERIIKFRAWARVGKWDEDGEKQQFEMILPDALCWDGRHNLIADSLKDVEDDCYFMQYTGMKDKNGVEIYEGDILNHGYCIRQGIFETDHLKRGMLTWILERENSSVVAICDQNMILPYEITGNIYQNPELLK